MSAVFVQLVPLLIVLLLIVPPFWKITKRSGWHPALSFLMIVPLVNLIFLWGLAFKKWPNDDISGKFE